MSSDPIFLTLDDALEIHADMIESYGGSAGVRDMGLLESALAQPRATFDGEYLLPNIRSMASAYLLSIAKNHPFIDGNKRTAAASAVVFLKANGFEFRAAQDEELAEITERVAASQATREELDQFFRERALEL